MGIESPQQRAEQDALDAVHETLSRAIGDRVDTEVIDHLAPVVLADLRARLGGYLIDPVLAGFNQSSRVETVAVEIGGMLHSAEQRFDAREIFLILDDPRADNMRTQVLRDAGWETLD